MGPFLLQNRNEDEIELVEEGALGAAGVVIVGELNNEVDNEVADAWCGQPGCRKKFFSVIP